MQTDSRGPQRTPGEIDALNARLRGTRRTRWWIVATLLAVVGLGAWLATSWPTREEAVQATLPDPTAGGDPAGTTGAAPAVGRIAGASGGPTAEEIANAPLFTPPPSWKQNDIAAYLDRLPLSVAATSPIAILDSDMIAEARTDKGAPGGGHLLYVPRGDTGNTQVSARYYYLKIGENRFVKVAREKQ